MTKSHVIVYSKARSSPLPSHTDNKIITSTINWYANPSTWINTIVMVASACAIDTKAAVARHEFSLIELCSYLLKISLSTTIEQHI